MSRTNTQKNKTYTCSFCQKVGNDFVTMAKDICPINGPNGGHQIPIFGDSY